MSEFLYTLRWLLNPAFWLRNKPTNRSWDLMILNQLKEPLFERINEYTVNLNGVAIWVKNYPYCYGYDYTEKNLGLPSRSTTLKLKDAINRSGV